MQSNTTALQSVLIHFYIFVDSTTKVINLLCYVVVVSNYMAPFMSIGLLKRTLQYLLHSHIHSGTGGRLIWSSTIHRYTPTLMPLGAIGSVSCPRTLGHSAGVGDGATKAMSFIVFTEDNVPSISLFSDRCQVVSSRELNSMWSHNIFTFNIYFHQNQVCFTISLFIFVLFYIELTRQLSSLFA